MNGISPQERHRFKSISYQDIGQGPVILLGHAYLWDSTMWQHQIAVLSQHFRCIVPDFWGHGESEAAPSASATLADYASLINELLEHLGIEQMGVAGHSLGGSWAIELGVLAPAKVKSLALLDSFAGLEPEVVNLKYQALLREAESAQCFSQTFIDFFTPLQFGLNTAQRRPELVAQFRACLAQYQGDAVSALAQAGRMWFGRRDSFEDAENFALPCLLLVGAQDRIRSVLESHLMLDGVTGSRLELIAEAGHLTPLEQPEEVTGHLLPFFRHTME
ncbi:alpha/beta fold hydrolase [Photobacterium sp. TLY01]|uniref:alpha/beta fold hydrolase n=1 Tax=Photobacterium sp. TLY01 TaxID=2907534 RepID=UPI001F18FB6A|nr:alpha/beta fold hydrolase [Photobacterium sp. TLY01]UIP29669.1 alpha/beta hydrolase [Photobacterium sp. TLY01]